MSLPTTTDAWKLNSIARDDFSTLELTKDVPLGKLGEDDVLLEIKAVSLNYRDLTIAKGFFPGPTSFPLTPTNDASAVILATGSHVTSFNPGDAVVVYVAPFFESGAFTGSSFVAAGDGFRPGLLQKYIVLPSSWVTRYPKHLSFIEASTIASAGITAWNTLFGAGSPATAGGGGPRAIKEGDWVLTQGTGALSLFAAGFAVKAGAKVIATTGKEEKKSILWELGVTEVLNYKEDENWGETAKKLTGEAEGVDMVVDVGGDGTIGQSLKAIRYDGMITVNGILSGMGQGKGLSALDVLAKAANLRGILVGSKAQHAEMAKKMEEWEFRPVVDKRVFAFEEADQAFQYLWDQKHVGKVVIEVSK